MMKNQMIVINDFLDLILFLYSHINNSKNEISTTNSSVASQICFDKCSSCIGKKRIGEELKNLGITNGASVIKTKTK